MYLLLFLVKLLFIQQKLAFRQFLLWNAPHGGASGALPLVALGALHWWLALVCVPLFSCSDQSAELV